MGFWEWGFGWLFFRAWVGGFRILGLGFCVQDFELRVQGSGCKFKGFGVQGTWFQSDWSDFGLTDIRA